MTFDLDVVLAAHGDGEGSVVNDAVRSLARQLERRVVGVRVRPAFHRGDPSYSSALAAANRPHRVVVPLLTSDGYHDARLQGAVIDAIPGFHGLTTMLPPLGTHPSFVDAFVHRVVARIDALDLRHDLTHIVVVGHGTTRHSNSAAATRNAAIRLQQAGLDRVRVAFLDEDPTVEAVASAIMPHEYLVVVPFLLGLGTHAMRDLPKRISASSANGLPADHVIYAEPISALAELAQLIEGIVRDTRPSRLVLDAGARGSALSRRQVELFATAVASLGVDVGFTEIVTRGDRDRVTAIDRFDGGDPFSREITDALLDGRIDVAVHSLKDLPLDSHPAVRNVAFLPRGSIHEVLIASDGRRLRDLPRGARIGTSCIRRATQLLRVRPDVVPIPIRGDVPARVAAVDRGDVDGVILAAAGIERLGLRPRVTEHFDLEAFVPAPGQGTIVVQCLADSPHAELLARTDDPQTRRAVEAELQLARLTERGEAHVTAAYATVVGPDIKLVARLIDSWTHRVRDTIVEGREPNAVASEAARQLMDLPGAMQQERAS